MNFYKKASNQLESFVREISPFSSVNATLSIADYHSAIELINEMNSNIASTTKIKEVGCGEIWSLEIWEVYYVQFFVNKTDKIVRFKYSDDSSRFEAGAIYQSVRQINWYINSDGRKNLTYFFQCE